MVLVCNIGVQCRIVKRAMHGTRLMSWSEVRETYGRELVNLRNEGRYTFLNTLFSVSEAVLYMQAWPLSSVCCQSPAWQASPLCTAVGRRMCPCTCFRRTTHQQSPAQAPFGN